MKTLKEVVEECGFPVYVEMSHGGNYIVVGVYYGDWDGYIYEDQVMTRTGLRQKWDPVTETVVFYQALREDNEVISPKQGNICTCITLLNGHHGGCPWLS